MKKYLLLLLFFTLFNGNAFAHKINVFAWVEGSKINIESKFNGGKKVFNGKVVVSSNGKTVYQGKTNSKGKHSFKIPMKKDLKIIVDAGHGHKGFWIIKKEELDGSENDSMNKELVESDNNSRNIERKPSISIEKNSDCEVGAIVDEIIRKRLIPINNQIALLRKSKETRFQDIVGGIGYIFGLMGIFLYFKYGRKK